MSDCCVPHFWFQSIPRVTGRKSLPTFNNYCCTYRPRFRGQADAAARCLIAAAFVPMRNLHSGWRRFAGHPHAFAREPSRHGSPHLSICFDHFSSERKKTTLASVQERRNMSYVAAALRVTRCIARLSCSCRRLFTVHDCLREK